MKRWPTGAPGRGRGRILHAVTTPHYATAKRRILPEDTAASRHIIINHPTALRPPPGPLPAPPLPTGPHPLPHTLSPVLPGRLSALFPPLFPLPAGHGPWAGLISVLWGGNGDGGCGEGGGAKLERWWGPLKYGRGGRRWGGCGGVTKCHHSSSAARRKGPVVGLGMWGGGGLSPKVDGEDGRGDEGGGQRRRNLWQGPRTGGANWMGEGIGDRGSGNGGERGV